MVDMVMVTGMDCGNGGGNCVQQSYDSLKGLSQTGFFCLFTNLLV